MNVGVTDGFVAGASYRSAQSFAVRAGELILGVVLLAVIVLVVRHRRRERDSEDPADAPVSSPN